MKGGENEMQSFYSDRLWLINEMRDAKYREADNSRRFERSTPSIRRAVGASIVRFGARLAGDAPYELARSR
jgi:hypothetical protein